MAHRTRIISLAMAWISSTIMAPAYEAVAASSLEVNWVLQDIANRCQLLRERHDPDPASGLIVLTTKSRAYFRVLDEVSRLRLKQVAGECLIDLGDDARSPNNSVEQSSYKPVANWADNIHDRGSVTDRYSIEPPTQANQPHATAPPVPIIDPGTSATPKTATRDTSPSWTLPRPSGVTVPPIARDQSAPVNTQPVATLLPDRPQATPGAGSAYRTAYSTTAVPATEKALEPFFPWPPPQPYARDIIPNGAFTKLGARTLGEVAEKILEQLRAKTYPGPSFFAAGDGFALITHMERVDEQGYPLDAGRRWGDLATANLMAFSLREYLLGLFLQRSGFWRIFVFIVSSSDFIPDPNAHATPELVDEWQQHGRTTLPKTVANRLFSPAHRVHLLLYQFKKDEGHSPSLVSDASVGDHLRAAGLNF